MSATDAETAVTWLTQEAYDRLKAELDVLITNRPQVAQEINARREEGDLKENGGYHAAKEEQGKQEARIRQLEVLLGEAKVGQPPTQSTIAGPGMIVTVRFDGDDEPETFLVGSREIDAGPDLQVYSPESAMGRAITGKDVGATVSYAAPNGRRITVDIVEVKPFTG
ncbi:MAG: transcription elongation factor GreA [Pseudonocardiales bacterium]|nr:MAG: transcription elongation factor GreA [Pseudonocardiales bacterium]